MNQENLDYLKEKLKYSGFEDRANAELEKKIKAGTDEFQIPVKLEIEGRDMVVDLHFRKSNTADRYFFNKYDVVLSNQDERIAPKSHTFYQNQGITAKEAFNLLEGRAVYKSLLNQENEPYKAWVQLDLSQRETNGNYKLNTYHENYGFDLKKSLENLPIKEMQDPTKTEWLIKALAKGNVYPVVMEVKGKEEVMFLSASPKFKSVNVYDAQMRAVKTADLRLDKQQGPEDQDKKKDLERTKSVKEKIKERIAEPKSPPLSKSKGKRI
jgi:hypothetical protein